MLSFIGALETCMHVVSFPPDLRRGRRAASPSFVVGRGVTFRFNFASFWVIGCMAVRERERGRQVFSKI